MTTDKVKAKIIELCPNVMELKFGCEIKTIKYAWQSTVEKITWYNEELDEIQLAFRIKPITREDCTEILGSPITLSIVLRAIEQHLRTKFESQPNADLLSNFQEGLWNLTKDLLHKWNLEHDNYDQQSDECKRFIGSMIGVE